MWKLWISETNTENQFSIKDINSRVVFEVNYVTLVAFYTRPTHSSGISIMKTFLFLLNTNKIPTSKDEAKEQLIYMVVFLISVNNFFFCT